MPLRAELYNSIHSTIWKCSVQTVALPNTKLFFTCREKTVFKKWFLQEPIDNPTTLILQIVRT